MCPARNRSTLHLILAQPACFNQAGHADPDPRGSVGHALDAFDQNDVAPCR